MLYETKLNKAYPDKIVCLTEETTEILYRIGEDHRIIGITHYTVRPERAKEEKKVVSRYIDADISEIIQLKPDIVLAWSDLQANIVAELVKNGIEVMTYNHRSIQGILENILKVSSLVGAVDKGMELVAEIETKLDLAHQVGKTRTIKPKVYFEEWYNPLITGITWVSELINICGGIDLFSEKKHQFLAKDRIIQEPEVIEANPDIILASWCGAPFKKGRMLRRENWNKIKAVNDDEITHIDSSIILQPGPAALTDGLEIILKIFNEWERKHQQI